MSNETPEENLPPTNGPQSGQPADAEQAPDQNAGDSEWLDLDAPENAPSNVPATDAPIIATLVTNQASETVDSSTDENIRVGSPFKVDPITNFNDRPVETVIDGPLRYTAMGAVTAAAMTVFFAAAACYWFPAGGTMVAALGCVLSMFGFYSNHRLAAAACLSAHLSLFMFCYGRSLA